MICNGVASKALTLPRILVISVACAGSLGIGETCALSSPSSYAGLIDQYPTEGWTWGWSVYAPSSAYSGAFALIERTSDNATTTIGYDSSTHAASVAQFNSFCANTYCYVKTLYDSFDATEGHEDDAAQNVLANMPQMAVAANGRLEICAAPGSSMSAPYAPAYSTSKVEAFVVAYAGAVDWNGWQPNLPRFTITGNLPLLTHTITNVSERGVSQTFQGFSTASGGVWNPPQPGVEDVTHNYAIWWQQYAGEATAGSTTLSFAQASHNLSNEVGDAFELTNAVLEGPWVVMGPATGAYQSSAYWAFGLENYGGPGNVVSVKNATLRGPYQVIGQYMLGRWAVWDWDSYTQTLDYDGTPVTPAADGASVAYSTNVGLTLFSDASGAENAVNQCFQQMALINQTAANRTAVDAWLDAQFGITPMARVVAGLRTPDGFALHGEFLPPYPPAGYASAFGDHTVTDVNGVSWQPQTGAYLHPEGPSEAYATNVAQGRCSPPTCPTLWQFVVNGGDSDINITQHPRSEANGPTYGPGTHVSLFYEFKIVQMPDMTSQGGEWCSINQFYYGGGIDCLDRAKRAGRPTIRAQLGAPCGDTIAVSLGTVYASEWEVYYNPSGVSTAQIYLGPAGSPLPQQCNLSGNLFSRSPKSVTMKIGLYTGDVPWRIFAGKPGPMDSVVQVANWFVSTTPGTFSGYVASQPAWPTHP